MQNHSNHEGRWDGIVAGSFKVTIFRVMSAMAGSSTRSMIGPDPIIELTSATMSITLSNAPKSRSTRAVIVLLSCKSAVSCFDAK